MGPLPVVLIDERVSERHPTGMILRESDCGQRRPSSKRVYRRSAAFASASGVRAWLPASASPELGCGGTSFESGRTDLVECRVSNVGDLVC